jgi:hypothetical protein
MNQLSLNVLALTIFGMTLSVLLAPLLHVSEGFVAVTIMSIVGFTTIDAFAWKGKAATIFLDRVARFSKAHRDRVIRHEAGHFLIAQQLGFEVTDYSLSAWEASIAPWPKAAKRRPKCSIGSAPSGWQASPPSNSNTAKSKAAKTIGSPWPKP